MLLQHVEHAAGSLGVAPGGAAGTPTDGEEVALRETHRCRRDRPQGSTNRRPRRANRCGWRAQRRDRAAAWAPAVSRASEASVGLGPTGGSQVAPDLSHASAPSYVLRRAGLYRRSARARALSQRGGGPAGGPGSGAGGADVAAQVRATEICLFMTFVWNGATPGRATILKLTSRHSTTSTYTSHHALKTQES